MKRSYDCKFIVSEGDVIGFSFGSDITSECEWSIDNLRTSLGMDSDAIGLDYSIVHEFRFPLDVYEREGEMVVLYDPSIIGIQAKYKSSMSELIRWNELTCWKGVSIAAAWDDASFGIHVFGEENVKLLKKAVVEPWNDHDVALILGKLNDEITNKLFFLRASKIPEETKEIMRAEHLDCIALMQASDAINIREKLWAAGKNFFALTPYWAKDFPKIETDYPVIYWLNPMQQSENNFGFFSVENLILWINDKGPIPKH